jgi:hypothetical protein
MAKSSYRVRRVLSEPLHPVLHTVTRVVKKTNPEMDVIYFSWQQRQTLVDDHGLGTGSRYTELLNAYVNPDTQINE